VLRWAIVVRFEPLPATYDGVALLGAQLVVDVVLKIGATAAIARSSSSTKTSAMTTVTTATATIILHVPVLTSLDSRIDGGLVASIA